MKNIRAWLRQPSSVAGLATLLGTLSAVLSGQLNWLQAAPILAGATASVVLPDNTAARAEMEALVRAFAGQIVVNKEKAP